MTIPPHHKVVEAPPVDRPPLPAGTLNGEVAVVTGGGSGMGLAMASAFVQAGAKVAIFGRTQEKADQGAEKLRAMGGQVLAVGADVRDPAKIADVFDRAEAELGPVTILANNAGGNYPVLAEGMSAGQWRSITRIAIDGTFFCSTEFARRRIAAGGRGAIVNNSAQYIWTGFPGDAHSAAAKAAIATMSATQAQDWKQHRIRVNCVAAGFFPHAHSVNGQNADQDVRLGAMLPIARVGRMHEFGWISAFLCSPFAAGITGETLVIDAADRLRRTLTSPDFIPPREREVIWGDM
ncbi:SDR family oxidoreductase [Sphingobium sp. Sx8-8]|uniref:SDR family oxidoreductase n=1 Tax=Sphingobium sp. Sx8-8 TaxID=2933617 RepID=UPI001F5A7CD4|nr:SDR family oxidoreductase [Sphingobium sp. Sx8-8]